MSQLLIDHEDPDNGEVNEGSLRSEIPNNHGNH